MAESPCDASAQGCIFHTRQLCFGARIKPVRSCGSWKACLVIFSCWTVGALLALQ